MVQQYTYKVIKPNGSTTATTGQASNIEGTLFGARHVVDPKFQPTSTITTPTGVPSASTDRFAANGNASNSPFSSSNPTGNPFFAQEKGDNDGREIVKIQRFNGNNQEVDETSAKVVFSDDPTIDRVAFKPDNPDFLKGDRGLSFVNPGEKVDTQEAKIDSPKTGGETNLADAKVKRNPEAKSSIPNSTVFDIESGKVGKGVSGAAIKGNGNVVIATADQGTPGTISGRDLTKPEEIAKEEALAAKAAAA